MIEGIAGIALPLEVTLANRATGLFPRARIVDAAGAEVAGSPINLTTEPATAPGTYKGSWAVPLVGEYTARFDAFTDGTYTTLTIHEPGEEHLLIRALDQDTVFTKLLGHQGENVRDTVLTIDPDTGRPVTARRRIYPTAADAVNDTNHLIEITIVATYPSPSRWDDLVRTVAP